LTTLSPDVLQGAQRPRLVSYPRGVSTSGAEAAEFSALTGLVLDPWQVFALECLMQERADGKWAARTGVLIVPRQNGKGAVDEAWELAQLFLNGCRIVLHTAHHNKTAKSAFLKMRAHIEGSAMLKARLMDDRSGGIRIANGEYGFTFKSGQQLIYGTRTGGAGRGLTIDAMVLDEVQELKDDELDALKPTIATAPNPQTLMTGSAPKDVAEVLPRLMVRGRASDPALCYLEWSVDESQAYELDDRSFWALSNPGYGIRLFDDAIVDERGSMSDSGFARERLGVWSPPSESGVFPAGAWEAAKDVNADMPGVPMFAVEVAEDRSWAAIAAVGAGSSGVTVDVVDYKPGVDWVVPRVDELLMKNEASRVAIQPSSPAGS
jgi:phage terminase large subunit-like protein